MNECKTYKQKVDEELGKLSIDTLKERLRIYSGIQSIGFNLCNKRTSISMIKQLLEIADIAVENVENHLKKRNDNEN